MQKKIAITGGIGSGKSLAAQYVAELGYPIYSCDEINKELWNDPEYIEELKKLFPSCVNNGKFNKTILKKVVFVDKTGLKKLNAIAHPRIMKQLFSTMEKSESKFVFAEVPLLFEGGYEKFFDEIIVITRGLDERINAVKARDGLNEQEIKNRIAAQFDYSKLESYAQNLNVHVIINEGDMLSLKNEIQALIKRLK